MIEPVAPTAYVTALITGACVVVDTAKVFLLLSRGDGSTSLQKCAKWRTQYKISKARNKSKEINLIFFLIIKMIIFCLVCVL
jgi:hypothetical protein